jgi:hypothetical protein
MGIKERGSRILDGGREGGVGTRHIKNKIMLRPPLIYRVGKPKE